MHANCAKRVIAAAAIMIAMSLSPGCICNQNALPRPDDCQPGSAVGVDSFEIGAGHLDGSFIPWMDGSLPSFAVGGQGSTMLVMRIRISGANPPSCLQQKTVVTVSSSSSETGRDTTPRKTYEAGSGQRVTDDMYIIIDDNIYGGLTVTTTIGALEVTRHLGKYAPDLSASRDLQPTDLASPD
jgi:hypothetical protein